MVRTQVARVAADRQATTHHSNEDFRMRYLLIPLIVTACGAQDLTNNKPAQRAGAAAMNASPGVEHSVTGSGTQKIAPGFEYAVSVAVHSDASGRVWGEGTTRIIDLTAYGYPGSGVMQMKPECMRVVGNDAFIRFIITKSFDENFAHVGDRAVFWVRDGGPGGADVGHSGPAPFLDPGNTICTTTPAALSPDAISGNFIVH